MTIDDVLNQLQSLGSPVNVSGMERFGIVTVKAFGISTPVVKQFSREVKKKSRDGHQLALKLWQTGVFEARVVAALIDDPKRVTADQMDEWAADFDNWATVDGTCCYLFCRTPFAYAKATEWSGRDEEFIKRAGFALMAYLAIHDKKASDEKLAAFLPLIEHGSDDDR